MGKYKELKKEVAELRQKVESLKPYNWPYVENLEVQFEQVNELPEKWCVKIIQNDSQFILAKWFNQNSQTKAKHYHTYDFGYLHYPSFSLEDEKCHHSRNIIEGYTEITFDTFKRLVLKEECRIGEWVKPPRDEKGNAIYCIDSIGVRADNPVNSYGFNRLGEWSYLSGRSSKLLSWPVVPEEEVSAALIKEAERRGFKEGVEICHLRGNGKATLTGLKPQYFPDDNTLYMGTWLIFEKGKWATIIEPKEEQPIDWSVPGQLVKAESEIVRTTGVHFQNRFEGFVVQFTNGATDYNLDNCYSSDWAKSCFTLCTEPITLKN